jgi:hypothetical protein
MKLCKTFAEIESPPEIKGRVQSEWYWKGIHAANNALPLEALKEAILRLENTGADEEAEQLRAMMQEGSDEQ